MSAAFGILQSAIEKISARIAVSEEARTVVVQHLGGDPIVIPNGLYVDKFAAGVARPEWQGPAGTLSFLGRLDEPRKGLPVLLEAWPTICRERPGVRLLVAGRGDVDEIRRTIPADCRDAVTFLGGVSEEDKIAMFASSRRVRRAAYGERVLRDRARRGDGRGNAGAGERPGRFPNRCRRGPSGRPVPVGDAPALAKAALELLADPGRRAELSERARIAVRRYDWSTVADEVLAVYEMAVAAGTGHGRGRYRVAEDR